MSTHDKYIPALRFKQLTPLYDSVLRWVMREDPFKRHLLQQAHIQMGQRVLDLGCGTATLTVLIKQAHPDADVVGLDGDPQVLAIARDKATQAGVEITFDEGMAYQLPYPNDSFDRVLSSLMFHHLTTKQKWRTIEETFRVLKRGGEFHMVDFGKPHNAWAYVISLVARRLEETADNIQGALPAMFRQVGFEAVEETAQYMTIAGTLALYRARKPN